MYAMQYGVKLPTTYDMRIIRDRVARTGHLLDGFPGLSFKAYVIREKSRGAPHNEYAPFYVWDDIDGMRAFCWVEPGYSAIVRDFGRHPIQDWTVVDLVAGPAALADATSLTVATRTMPDGAAPSAVLGELTRDFLDSVGPQTVRRVAAVDVTSWNVVLVELSTGSVPADFAGAAYEVLHVSPGPPG